MKKHVNPVVDHALGAVIVLILLQAVRHFHNSGQLSLFGSSMLGTVFMIVGSKKFFHVIGKFVSSMRTKQSIPEKNRNPLKDPIVMYVASAKRSREKSFGGVNAGNEERRSIIAVLRTE